MHLYNKKQKRKASTRARYFDNPGSEEELNKQYRLLLQQFDCLSGHNSDLLLDIQSEYFSTFLALRRAERAETKNVQI